MNRLFEEEKWNYKIIVIPIMLLFTFFLTWATFSELDEMVKGDGKVVPSGKTKVLQHLEGGIVSSILVREGDEVKKGDVIYELSQSFFTADSKAKEIQLDALQAALIRILNEINLNEDIEFSEELKASIPDIVENERQIFEVDTRTNLQKIGISENQLKQKILKYKELEAKEYDLNLELQLSRENMKMFDKMYKKKVVSKQKYLKELQIKQALVTKISNTRNTLPIVQQEINEALGKVKTVKSEIKAKLLKEYSKVQVEINSLVQKAKADKDRSTRRAIISPVDGTIQKLYFYTVGGIIKAGDKVAEITPNNDSLIIEAKIKTSDRALVWSGQNVKIAITAYDTSKYGLLEGRVLFISADSQTDQASQATYYLVRVMANKQEFAPELPILPGMVANINILTGKKTIMQYILKPLKDISRNSLTEK
ncbi:MAG TPA: HlyD family type I secretion periplasmic adaptor subunit [Arcobacter sp.]|nr:HlyD family type I secretion periplasmic adaptor subunit [Arcobacter sp.]